MNKILIFVLVLMLCQGVLSNASAVKIHTIGDSTMADYDENTTDKRGWAMMFQQFFTSDVVINNRAKSGASSKSFYKESAYWSTVKPQIETGDYVFIQFAHNDEKNGGLDGDEVRKTDPTADYRGTTAQGTYKEYLRNYVNESRSLGATPILVTPICRKYFSGNSIKRKGKHDLGDDYNLPESDNTHDYVYAMKEVATELSVEVIDLTALTESLYLSYGDAASTKLLFCTDDSTHPNAMGGTLIARLCAQAMSSQGILAEYVNASSDLQVNPTQGDFGKAYVGQTLTKEFTVTGFDLTPASGSFNLSVSEGFSIALDKTEEFTSSVSLNYANSNLDFTKFYVAASSASNGTTTGTLTISNGEMSKEINLTANFIELTGGTEVNLSWNLSADTNYDLTGPAIPVDESFSSMYVQRYSKPNSNTLTESTKWDVEQKMQRNLVEGDTWPANEIDEVSTRYIQFGITANDGTDLDIDSIGMFVAAAGGNGMRCRISYSTNNFSDYTVIQEFPSMVANTVYEVSAIPVLKLTEGETLLVRVYPWYSGEATGKTICLGDLTIHGMASTPTAIEQNEVISIDYTIDNGVVRFINTSAIDQISIYNINGSKVYSTTNSASDQVEVAGLSKGIYVAKIVSGQKAISVKVCL